MTAPKAIYSVVRRNFYHPKLVDRPQLFAEIGHPELAKNVAWANTCAIRLSLAPAKSGVAIPGRMVIKIGKYKGRWIEQNVVRLASHLTSLYGKPGGMGQRKRRICLHRHQAGHRGLSFAIRPGYRGAQSY